MTDHKSWLWKKKSTEKTLVAAEKVDLSLKGNEDEIQRHLTEKAELERDLKILNDRLSLALSDCNTKDELVKQHAKMAQEAVAGWETAEAEALSLKQELEEVLQQRATSGERLMHLDAALKECMHQLRFVREEQEHRIHDALMKASKEFEKTKTFLEENLAETSKRLTKLGAENTQLSKALLAKEKLINDLNDHKTRAATDFNALLSRVESTEKENGSLKYEVRVLEKELEIRNEEREFNRRTADVAHKQHLESVKKIAKLESESQRLRVLVRKRLPGPAALAKMKNEVEILGRDSGETRRRRSNLSLTSSMDFSVDSGPDTPTKRVNFLAEQLCALEEENRNLKETLQKNTNELQFSRNMYSRTASKLSQAEAQLEDSSKGETRRNIPTPHGLSMASMSDIGSDDKASCAESWASALISELDHFKIGKQTGTPSPKNVGALEMNLMDDFVEMEKLAIVSGDKSAGSSHPSSNEGREIVGPLETMSSGYLLATAGQVSVPVSDCESKVPGWLQNILDVIWEQNRVSKRNPDEILKDITVALAYTNHRNPNDLVDAKERSNHPDSPTSPHVSGCISRNPQVRYTMINSNGGVTGDDLSLGKKRNPQMPSNLSKSIFKIIKLIEGINLPSPDYGTPETLSAKDGSFYVRVFQWKTLELGSVLQRFVQTCYDLVDGKADLESFAQELTSALDWIVNHCFSLQDVSSMRDAIKKHLDWDETRSESEIEGGMICQFSESDMLRIRKEQLLFQMEEHQPNVKEDSKRSKDELANVEGRLLAEIDKSDLIIRLLESEKTVESLHIELETLKQSKRTIEEQVNDHKLVNEDLDNQLTIARVELNEARQKLSSLETEFGSKHNCCEKLEATCTDLQLQLESDTKKEIPTNDMDREEKQLRTDWEITAASEKLAECQETILNLGKQLKALASPTTTALFDKAVSTPTETMTTITSPRNNNQRSSLLDKMLAEDNAEVGDPKSPKTKEVICTSDFPRSQTVMDVYSVPAFHSNGATDHPERFLNYNGNGSSCTEASMGSLAIVPIKKKGGEGLFKKFLWRRKRGNSKKTLLPFAA